MSGRIYISTGSALERNFICDASAALPRNSYTTEYTERGQVIHAFLESCTNVGREGALVQVPEDYREICEALDVSGLEGHLSLAAEVSFAYDFTTDTARELGRGAGREYSDVKPTEIPCTLDTVGVRDLPSGVRRGFYSDWKSGFRNTKSIATAKQIDFGALCVARAYNCDLVEGQLVNVREDFPPFVQKKTLEGFELDMFGEELRAHAARWIALRSRFLSGEELHAEYEIGPWCDGCNSREFCPGQTSLLRTVLDASEPGDISALPDDQLSILWERIGVAQSALSTLKKRILGIASSRPVRLGDMPDGSVRWLAVIVKEGNEILDGESVFDAVAELFGDEVATAATKVTATKKGIDSAIKAVAARGKKAGMLRDLYAKLATIPGAIVKKPSTKIAEIALPAAERPLLLSRRDDEPPAEEG